MALSSSSQAARRKHQQRRPFQRESSIIGRFKTYISSSLGFGGNSSINDDDRDDFDDDRDEHGKRRRVLTERENRDPKRLRVSSPEPSRPSTQSGYLDPPAASFNFSPPKSRLSQGLALSTLSLADNGTPPPPRYSLSRDISMPPNPYRLRASGTPQLATRDSVIPDPPAVSSLISNPMFVRNPSQGPDVTRAASRQPMDTTLGMLADSQRTTRSPVRQHSSLVFDSPRASPDVGISRVPNAAERALQGLDAYKTPLLPSRATVSAAEKDRFLSSNSNVFNMYGRRKAKLELMRDERDKRRLEALGVLEGKAEPSKPSDDAPNGTKPYAGSGGLRKLLERRKKEAKVVDDMEQKFTPSTTRPLAEPAPVPTVPSTKDWYSAATNAPSQGSSLRVGRAKISRSHISRPGRPQNNRFSAQEDEAEDDEEEQRRQQEHDELAEAARKAPKFNIPAGFTFAKDTKPIQQDTTNAKEPPITSLPFSFGSAPKPATAPVPLVASSNEATAAPSSIPTFSFDKPAQLAAPHPENKKHPKTDDTAHGSLFLKSSAPSPPSAPISLVATPLPTSTAPVAVEKPATLPSIAPASSQVSDASAGSVVDPDSPFWEGKSEEKKPREAKSSFFEGFGSRESTALSTTSLFGQPQAVESKEAAKEATPSLIGRLANPTEGASLFGGSAKTPGSASGPSGASFSFGKPGEPQPSSTDFSFGKPSEPQPTPSGFSFGKPSEPQSAPSGFSMGQSQEPSKPEQTDATSSSETPKASAPTFSFGQTSTFASESPKSLFGGITEPKPLFGTTKSESTNSLFGGAPASGSTSLNFGQQGQMATATPQPTSTFSFGAAPSNPFGQQQQKTPESAKPTSPFTLGAAPSTPPVENKPAFSFGAPAASTTPTASVHGSFSFGTTATPTSTAENKTFSFSQPGRAATPPKEQGRDEMNMDESPTREIAPSTRPAEPRPTLGGTGFSFGSTATSSNPFGQANQSSNAPSGSSFSFGGTSTPSFGQPKSDGRSSPFSFGSQPQQPPQTSTGVTPTFAFGAQPDNKEAQRPATTGSFSFSPSTSTGSSTGPTFAFGATQSSSNPFGQTSSTPSSPSGFGQTNSFTFGSSQQSSGNPFQTSSQPSSPATSSNTLPSGGPFPFGGGSSANPAGNGGSASFTMGAAPPANPNARPKRGLPRRAGKR